MIETDIKLTGLQDSIRAISKIDKNLAKQLKKDFEKAAAPMLRAALDRNPNQPPLSGWARRYKGKPLWAAADRRGVRLKMDTRRPRRQRPNQTAVGVLKMQTKTRGTAMFDMAGRADKAKTVQGQVLIAQLRSRYGAPSRMMWPAAESTIDNVQRNLRPVINKVILETQKVTG